MITLMRPWACLLLLIILSDVLGMEYKEPEKEKVFKALNGSWIFAEYTINVLDGKESSEPQYHQINATYNNALRGMTVSEVDVTTGEVTKHLFDLYEMELEYLVQNSRQCFQEEPNLSHSVYHFPMRKLL